MGTGWVHSFSCDLIRSLPPLESTIVVRAPDPTAYPNHGGKQSDRYHMHGLPLYTDQPGDRQTVWLETVPLHAALNAT